jgi:hypothetical protein
LTCQALTQMLEGGEWDRWRTCKFFIMGAGFIAPLLHHW